jgi:tetratricopeptide (TPR) repeat protein
VIDNFKAFFTLYAKPGAAFSVILDRGRLWFAIVLALFTGILLHWTDVPPTPGSIPIPPSPLDRFISYVPASYLAPLLILAIVIVPAILLVRAIAGFGNFVGMLTSDYVPLLMCSLFAWAAAYLPLAILNFLSIDAIAQPAVYAAFNAAAALLTAIAVRTFYGAGFPASIGLTALSWSAGAASAYLIGLAGGAMYFLASPLVLFYLYMAFGQNLRSLGDVLRNRQHFRRQLEIATNNPHDADAHFQLGLIHQGRRQLSEAASRFTQAVKIDPQMADAHLQLGVIAREQGRINDAIDHLKIAATIDDRLSQSEVWRELGASLFAAGRFEDARAALDKFTARREYDPEGLYWFGKTLKQLGDTTRAREMFHRAIEAARTMPAHRRAQVRVWASRSRSEL